MWGMLVLYSVLGAVVLLYVDPPQPQPTGVWGGAGGGGDVRRGECLSVAPRVAGPLPGWGARPGCRQAELLLQGSTHHSLPCSLLAGAVPEEEGRKEVSRNIFARLQRQVRRQVVAPLASSLKRLASTRSFAAPTAPGAPP